MSLSHREGSRGGVGKIILKVSAWGGWGSCGESGRGRVQICHKGVPRRDRPRRKARNINDSSRALRLDRGLCGRFGQSAGADRPGRASAGRTAGPAPERTIPPGPLTPPGPRERRPGQDPGARTGPRGSRPSRVPPGRPDPTRSRKNGSRKSDGPGAGEPAAEHALPADPTPDDSRRGRLDAPRHTQNNLPGRKDSTRSDAPRITFPARPARTSLNLRTRRVIREIAG